MKKLAPFFLLLLIPFFAASQQEAMYQQHIFEAQNLFAKGDYPAATQAYSAAFDVYGGKGYLQDRYDAARAWALAGVPDSAFFCLNRIAERLHYDNLEAIQTEKAFEPLRGLAPWEPLRARVAQNQKETKLFKPVEHKHPSSPPSMPKLAAELEGILGTDQIFRQKSDSLERIHGRNSPEMTALWDSIRKIDDKNQIRVCQILDEKGWLGPDEVGENGATALFLIIQHAPLETQEKYLPGMREAVKKGTARGADLALLEDRVLIRNGKKQIYGSQVVLDPATLEKVFAAIEDVDHVDERRAAMGLSPMSVYALHFNIVWDVAAIEKNKVANPPSLKKQ